MLLSANDLHAVVTGFFHKIIELAARNKVSFQTVLYGVLTQAPLFLTHTAKIRRRFFVVRLAR